MEVLNYKCPNCSAGLKFDSSTQKMTCEYCGSSYTVEELEELVQTADPLEKEDTKEHWEGFDPGVSGAEENMAVWNCPSCGAQLITEKTAGAAVCPYCSGPMVMPEQFEGVYRPDFVIPFSKSKKDALEALKQHYLGKPLLPGVFKKENHLEEIKAVYVPFWLFDLDAAGRLCFRGTRTRFWEDRNYQYTETSHFYIVRQGKMSFSRIPADGSEKISDAMMESIEPYDYRDLQPFRLSYLSGYMADKYDMEPDDLTSRVEERMKESMDRSFRETLFGYETLIPVREDIHMTKKGRVAYALLPVWFLNTKWQGKTYSFVMNGQTGRFCGDLPTGRDMVLRYWMKIHIPMTAGFAVLFLILRMTGVI